MKDYIYLDNEKTNYYITKTGEVYNEDTSKELKGTISKHGYRVISFKWNGKTVNKYLHRLLATTYLNFDENSDLVINHKDGNKLNNKLENLRYVSQSENIIAAAYQQKTKACKAVDVFKNGNFVYHYNSIAEASRELKVDGSSISKVCKGKQKTACGYVFRYSE